MVDPEGFPTSAVTRSMAKSYDQLPHKGKAEAKLSVFVCTLLPSISPNKLMNEQSGDPSLKPLFEQIFPEEDFQSASQEYFVLGDILVRKLVPRGDNYLGKPVVQIVVPQKFRQMVLKAAHDDTAGHVGVRKIPIFCTISFFPTLKVMSLLTLRRATFVNLLVSLIKLFLQHLCVPFLS